MEYIVGFPQIEDIEKLKNLNNKFLINNLDPLQREKGFIRIEYNLGGFKNIVKEKEVVVAFNFNEIVAYYMIGKKASIKQLDYQKEMAKKLEKKHNIPFDKIGYGCQVCIDKDFRRLGLFKLMLKLLKNTVKNKYDYLLCSISDFNIASLKAHSKNNWKFIEKIDTTNFYILKV